jgi:hypothetical protein
MPLVFNFKINGIDFTVDDNGFGKWTLTAINSPKKGIPQTFLKERIVIFKLLLTKNQVSGYEDYHSCYQTLDFYNALGLKTEFEQFEGYLTTQIERIRKKVLNSCGFTKLDLPFSLFLETRDSNYCWVPPVETGEYFDIKRQEHAKIEFDACDEAEGKVSQLISDLLNVSEYRNELSSYFFNVGVETFPVWLPFFEMKEETFGRPNFALTITDQVDGEEVISSPPVRHDDSLLDKRKALTLRLGKPFHFYPGHEYRLLSAKKGKPWLIGRTIFTDLIESCDYLAFKIKSGWQLTKEGRELTKEGWQLAKGNTSEDAVNSFFRDSPATKEWFGLIQQYILKGDFTKYIAGMAFSVPIFQVQDGKLRLLVAKGSSEKISKYGYHCVPAGLLEFSESDSDLAELTLGHFQTIVAKEMVEETLPGKNFMSVKDKNRPMFQGFDSGAFTIKAADQFTAEIYRLVIETIILKNWDDLWAETKDAPSKTFLEAVLKFDPAKHGSFWFVDCFTLRPEIVIPLYTSQDLKFNLNWEFEKGSEKKLEFEKWPDVLDEIMKNRDSYSAPGIACLYFGAKRFFDTPKEDWNSLLLENILQQDKTPPKKMAKGEKKKK